MKGGLNFINDRFVDIVVAVLDNRGCAVYNQKVHGPFRKTADREGKCLKVNIGVRVERGGGCVEIHSGWRVHGILLRVGGTAGEVRVPQPGATTEAPGEVSENYVCTIK